MQYVPLDRNGVWFRYTFYKNYVYKMRHHMNILEPEDQNIEYERVSLYLSLRTMQGEDAEVTLEELSEQDRHRVKNFVMEQMRGVQNMHPNILVKDLEMGEDEFEMMLGNTIQDEDVDVSKNLISEYLMSETSQNKFPKIDNTRYKIAVELE
jgi:hypothetical protein